MRALKSFLCIAALATCLGGVAQAHEHGRFVVKAGVAGVLPDESAQITPIGGTVDISDEYVPAAILQYDFSDRISAQLFCCLAPHEVAAVDTAAGRVDLGEVTLFPPTVTVLYRFLADGPVRPYAGVGVNYTTFFNEELPGPSIADTIDYDDSFGLALQAGADFPLNDRWAINIDVKKVWIEPEVTINGAIKAEVEINPVIAFVGVGYRF